MYTPTCIPYWPTNVYIHLHTNQLIYTYYENILHWSMHIHTFLECVVSAGSWWGQQRDYEGILTHFSVMSVFPAAPLCENQDCLLSLFMHISFWEGAQLWQVSRAPLKHGFFFFASLFKGTFCSCLIHHCSFPPERRLTCRLSNIQNQRRRCLAVPSGYCGCVPETVHVSRCVLY